MDYIINGKKFNYVSDYKHNVVLRGSYCNLAKKIFRFDVEHLYQYGYWSDNYIPHSLIYENTVVANASVSFIQFDINGEKKQFIQIGTVMTDPEFCSLGLSRIIMENIVKTWQNKRDMIYLFANDKVLNFYPKFGFENADEYRLSKELNSKPIGMAAQKIDMSDERSRRLFQEKICKSKAISS